MQVQKHSTIHGNSHEDFTGLGSKINDSKDYIEKKYNSKRNKNFSENIITFSKERDQYKKRFPIKECCEKMRIATIEDYIINDDRIIYTPYGNIISNIILWGDVKICSECGCIVEDITIEITEDTIKEKKVKEDEPTEKEVNEMESILD